MKYKASPIQRDFFIECMVNPKVNSKYSINMIFSLILQEEISEEVLLETICNTLNNQPLLSSSPVVENSEIVLNTGKPLKTNEIIVEYNNYQLESGEFFNTPFDLTNDSRLFRIKLVKKSSTNYSLLLAVHHFIFDFYSARALTQQIIDALSREKIFTFEQFQQELHLTNQKFKEKGIFTKYENIFQTRLSNLPIDTKKNVEDFLNLSKFEFRTKIEINKNFDNNHRSAILIAAFAYEYLRITNNSHVIVGVPVPNRIRGNKDLIDGLVTTYPVVILKSHTIEECRESVYKQLVENLKMQFFDFNKKFYKFSNFDIMFTYYPSKFIVSNSTAKIIMNRLFTIVPPSPIHLMLNDDNILLSEFSTNQIQNKSEYIQKSLNHIEGGKYG